MTRKSGKHLHTEQLFRPYWVSSAVHTVIEPKTTVCRSRISTTGPPVHFTYKCLEGTYVSDAELTSHGDNARPFDRVGNTL